MKKISRKTIGLLLVIILCFSLVPASAFATGIAENTGDQVETNLDEEIPEEPGGVEAGDYDGEPKPQEPIEVPVNDTEETPKNEENGNGNISITNVVDAPLATVEYRYYDATKNQGIANVADYSIESSHTYHALASANDSGIIIAANKYPGKVAVSTETLRFCVLLNGSQDVTAQVSYDAATGVVSLPAEYAGNSINVIWFCPTTDIVELPVKVTIGVFSNGRTEMSEQNLSLASNAGSIAIPLSGIDRIVVNQNGLELFAGEYSMNGDTLTVNTSALGGDLVVSAFPIKSNNGFSVMAASTTVNHERQHYNSVNYGYVTSYYVANGNVAYCLDPSVSGVNSGSYDISGYMQRGTGNDNIIKAAWYLYRCPGEDASLFSGLDWEHAYGYSHVAASYIYLEIIGDSLSKAWEGLEGNAAAQNRIMGIVNAIKSKPMPPSGFSVYLYNVGNQTSQSLMGWEYKPNGNLEIHKSSANPAISNGNGCYSLEGAVFDVYNSNKENVGSITTDKDGKGRLEGLPAGADYYIVEVTPPTGYMLDATPIEFEIVSGDTVIVPVKDIPHNDPVGILLKKLDKDLNGNTSQGNTRLEGAEFTIKYYDGYYSKESELKGKTPVRTWVVKTGDKGTAYLHQDYIVPGSDELYKNTAGDPALPLGTVTIQESKAPEGYLINDELFIRQITGSGKIESVKTYNEPEISDEVIRGGVSIEKWDFELNRRAVPQGDAILKGAVLDIYNRSVGDVEVGDKKYKPGDVVYTMTTDDMGAASTVADLLPYGTYEIIERTAPTSYLNTGVIKQTFKIKDNGVIVNLKTSATTIKNDVLRGGLEIEKWDMERNMSAEKQGDATLAGAVLEIWNRSKSVVVVDGKEYAPNTVVHTLTTDTKGWAGTSKDLLPFGSYEIIEKTPPTGYLNTGVIKQSFTIRENGKIESYKTSEKAIKNYVIRGGVRVEKWDNEIDEHRPQGGATLESAVFELVNRSIDDVLVLGEWYAPGEVVFTMTTDEDGVAMTAKDLLPYGTYEVREIQPPEGYLATGVLSRTFEIRVHEKIVDMNTSETAIKNDPIRGDLKGVKISDGDGNRLAGVPFSITSLTTGESHTIVTDKNGMFDTSSSWNPHSQDTNRGETDHDGIWFGELETLDNDNGALLYDTYLLEEQPCKANADRELLSFEVSIYRHLTVVDLGTLTNDYTVVPEIFTTAMDKETTINDAHVSATTEIVDTVYYSGLLVGKEYTLTGTLMDKESGNPLLDGDGNNITATTTFKALGESGNVSMTFMVDTLLLKGKAVVVFESLEFKGKEIAVHADIEDEGQTVTFRDPQIGTTATGSDGEKELDIYPETAIIDVVSFEDLIVGETYTVKGTLIDKSTGEPLEIDSKQFTAEKSFVAKAESGTVEIEFVVDSILLKGKTIVVFESLEYKGREIAVHAEIEDEGQTVTFKEPKIGTSASGVNGDKEILALETATIVDVVSYENLAVGKTYTVKGMLMDKSTDEPLLVDDKQITGETTFVAKEASGSVEVVFTLNAVSLKGKEVVVFENLYYKDAEIAAHANIEDEGQTVVFKEVIIKTNATGADGNKVIPVAESVKIVDTVTYENLVVGEEYTLTGTLMDKETGKPVLVDGKEITATKTFVAKEKSGSVEVEFVFNAMTLEGKVLVVFESLEYKGKEIATHADLGDQAQTVGIGVKTVTEETPGTGGGAKTGRDGLPFWLLFVAIGAAIGAALIYSRHKKKQTGISE